MANWILVEGTLADGFPMRLYVAERDERVAATSIADDDHPLSEAEFVWRLGSQRRCKRFEPKSAPEVLKRTAAQVREYFAGVRTAFDLPLAFAGTPFQIRVWEELTRIPFGASRSYADIAERIGYPAAFRAVGNANGRNRLPILVPCHRVIAAGGKLGGFTGGIGLKQRLLAHEAEVVRRGAQARAALA